MPMNRELIRDFIKAVREEDCKDLLVLLNAEPKVINECDEEGRWLMFVAVLQGSLPILEQLVTYADVNISRRDEQGNNLLYYAVQSRKLEVVRFLVEQVGISPEKGNIEGYTPYDLAIKQKCAEICDYFKEYFGAPYEQLYHNPIQRGMFPDPSIVRVGEDYYMVNSTFIFFPAIPVSHSRDLIHWEIIGHAIADPKYRLLSELEGGMGFWAPDISYHNGRFTIIVTLRMNNSERVRRKQVIVSSDHAEGPYSAPEIIEEDGIDPSIFHDDDGRHYMMVNRGAKLVELDEEGRTISDARLLWLGDIKIKPEGPHMLKKDGYYYLFLAEGGTGIGHCITVSRSRELFGPYETCPYNPILHQTDTQSAIQCCGHGKPFQTQNGEWYMVYLCNRYVEGKYAMLGRETAMDPITWTADGWPIINKRRQPSSIQKKPRLSAIPDRRIGKEAEKSGFCSREIQFSWMTPREPLINEQGKNRTYFVEEGILRIYGQHEDLNSMACRSVLVRRQTDWNFTARGSFILPVLEEGLDLGLTSYYDENSFIKCGATLREGSYGILLKEYVKDGYCTEHFWLVEGLDVCDEVEIIIQAAQLRRSFFYALHGGTPVLLTTLPSVEYLSSEGLRKGKRFTGAMIGCYVYGDYTGEFTNFSYQGGF